MDGLTFLITGILESAEREEAADFIQRYGGQVTQSVSKKKSQESKRVKSQVIMGRDPGRVNFPRYIVMHSSKEEEKKNCEHKHISCTFSLNFYNKSGCSLLQIQLGNLSQICIN